MLCQFDKFRFEEHNSPNPVRVKVCGPIRNRRLSGSPPALKAPALDKINSEGLP